MNLEDVIIFLQTFASKQVITPTICSADILLLILINEVSQCCLHEALCSLLQMTQVSAAGQTQDSRTKEMDENNKNET